jgi:hypothetical protein
VNFVQDITVKLKEVSTRNSVDLIEKKCSAKNSNSDLPYFGIIAL